MLFTTRTTSRSVLAVLAVAGLSLGATACSDDDGDDDVENPVNEVDEEVDDGTENPDEVIDDATGDDG